MAAEEEILALMRLRGPILPVDAAKAIKMNLIFAGAYLSELASRGKVKISHLKVGGGSPLYYLPGQEARLADFAKNLDQKEVRVLELLRQKKVLRDATLDPLTRVALRNMKDFAVALNVTVGATQEMFWKWYLLGEDDTKEIIRHELALQSPQSPDVLAPTPLQSQVITPSAQVTPVAEQAQSLLPTSHLSSMKETVVERPVEKQEALSVKPEQKVRKERAKHEKKTAAVGVPFGQSVRAFFETKGIRLIREDVVRKDAEASYIIEVPSAMGYLRYICCARNKRKCTDKDLSSALVEGQLKKLPVVFLYPGELTPKALEMVKTETFRSMVLTRLSSS